MVAVSTGGCLGDRDADRALRDAQPPTHDQIVGEPALKAAADQLRHTIVTPHLAQPISGDANVLWCATWQIAWNELCRLIGEDVKLADEPPMVSILNKKTVTRDDLDDRCYIALAGLGSDALTRIRDELQRKFHGAASPSLLPPPESLPPDVWVTYSYLFATLPFEWAFERPARPLDFAGADVECFGIDLPREIHEFKAAQQVLVYDYCSERDFILELKTRSKEDRLILAKVPPKATLAETIAAVQRRAAESKPKPIAEHSSLMIPVLNFDVLRDYHELRDKKMIAKTPRFDGSRIAIAQQDIRFKLDETGAVLKSEAIAAEAAEVVEDLIFDRPFLVTLERAGAAQPYFALWVGNAELLVRSKAITQ